MKKVFCKIMALTIAVSSVATFVGCGTNSSSENSTSTTTAIVETTAQNDENFDMKSLHTFDAESSDPFAGVWHITAGEGISFKNFQYLFDGNGKGSMVIDNMGYCQDYGVTQDSTQEGAEGKSTFTCQFMFGINGVYTYEFSDSNSKVVLTNISSNKTTTMEKLVAYDFVPIPDAKPVVDNDLVGAWKSDSGEYYYFSKDGLMYHNQYGTIFTYYSYSAKENVITATYKMKDEVTETYDYTVDGDKLTMNNFEYTRISTSELDKF